MKLLCLSFLLFAATLTASAQGTIGRVNFANYVPSAVDAPVWHRVRNTGPGLGFSAQLLLVGDGGSLTPLVPVSRFLTAGIAHPNVAQGVYWEPRIVEVPGAAPGDTLNFIVRVWLESLGSYEAAKTASIHWGESQVFSATLGGETPANLVNLSPFITVLPEPGIIPLCLLGIVLAAAFRKRLPNG